jgi:hypothetical protein
MIEALEVWYFCKWNVCIVIEFVGTVRKSIVILVLKV